VPGHVDSDSSEIMTNVIARNLICQPNTVGGHKIGQCAGL
jgi:hypothetical protein